MKNIKKELNGNSRDEIIQTEAERKKTEKK